MDDDGDSRRGAMATKGFLGEDDYNGDRHDRGDLETHRLCYAKLRKRGRLILTDLVSRFNNLVAVPTTAAAVHSANFFASP